MSEIVKAGMDGAQFELTTTNDDEQTCAEPGCTECPQENLSLILGCTMQGMAADYGTVGFCSADCATTFANHDTLHAIDQYAMTIFTSDPVLTEVELRGRVVETTIGHNIEAATEKAREYVETQVDDIGHDMSEFTLTYTPLG